LKLTFVGEVLDRLRAAFSVVTLREHAALAGGRPVVTVMHPSF
jgi:hypothetical protein